MSTNEKQKLDMGEIKKKINKKMGKINSKFLVLSNKGGVGKTTVSVLITRILEAEGKKVGLLDADIHGPSTLKALGMEDLNLKGGADNTMYPLEKGNVKLISVGSLLENRDTPLIWRGPMKSNLIRQFLSDVQWGELDYLVIDSPPGTGDEPMSIMQFVDDLTGGIIVTTPQDIALLDSRKCVNFLGSLNVPVLGIIENMSGFVCPSCGSEIEIFKKGGGEKAASELGVPFLGSINLDPRLVQTMDSGLNYIMEFPNSRASLSMKKIMQELIKQGENLR